MEGAGLDLKNGFNAMSFTGGSGFCATCGRYIVVVIVGSAGWVYIFCLRAGRGQLGGMDNGAPTSIGMHACVEVRWDEMDVRMEQSVQNKMDQRLPVGKEGMELAGGGVCTVCEWRRDACRAGQAGVSMTK